MTDHILNRPSPPRAPAPPAPDKLTPDQQKAVKQLQRTKAAEAVHRAIGRNR